MMINKKERSPLCRGENRFAATAQSLRGIQDTAVRQLWLPVWLTYAYWALTTAALPPPPRHNTKVFL